MEHLGPITDLFTLMIQHVYKCCEFQMSEDVEGGSLSLAVFALRRET